MQPFRGPRECPGLLFGGVKVWDGVSTQALLDLQDTGWSQDREEKVREGGEPLCSVLNQAKARGAYFLCLPHPPLYL